MTKISTRSWQLREKLLDREAFETHGALSAVRGSVSHMGQLNVKDPRAAEEYFAQACAGNVAYTVLSYSTPIGWVLADGEVVVPSVKYSRTTSKHQGLLYALKLKAGDPESNHARQGIRGAAQREREQARERRYARNAQVRVAISGPTTAFPAFPALQWSATESADDAYYMGAAPVVTEDPTASLEDRMAALEAETFAQIRDSRVLLQQSRGELAFQDRVDAAHRERAVFYERAD